MDNTEQDMKITYIGPEITCDYTLAELRYSPHWHLYLICDWQDGTIDVVDRRTSDRSRPMDEYHGLATSYRIQPMTRQDFRRLLDLVTPLVARVCAGFSAEWDGSNHLGVYTLDAEEALEALDERIDCFAPDGTGTGDLWDAADWLEPNSDLELGITAQTTEEDIAERAAEIQDEAHYTGCHLYDIEEELLRRRDNIRGRTEVSHG